MNELSSQQWPWLPQHDGLYHHPCVKLLISDILANVISKVINIVLEWCMCWCWGGPSTPEVGTNRKGWGSALGKVPTFGTKIVRVASCQGKVKEEINSLSWWWRRCHPSAQTPETDHKLQKKAAGLVQIPRLPWAKHTHPQAIDNILILVLDPRNDKYINICLHTHPPLSCTEQSGEDKGQRETHTVSPWNAAVKAFWGNWGITGVGAHAYNPGT